MTVASPSPDRSIWLWAGAYFAAYVPYTALTKAISAGMIPAGADPVPGASLLPASTLAAMIVAGLFLGGTGWWRHAVPAGGTIPRPRIATFVAGLCTATILVTTTLAYTFRGISVLLMVLALRGGVLILAPLVDLLVGRRPRKASLLALVLALVALGVASGGDPSGGLSLLAGVNVAAYLASYFVRLQIMSRYAKSSDRGATLRFFAEEQMVITPVTVAVLAGIALATGEGVGGDLRLGWGGIGAFAVGGAALVGVFSQGTGIFGTLVFLDPRENTYAVLVNRCASILAGVAAAALLTWTLGAKPPATEELYGAALLIVAITMLALSDRRK